MGCIATHNSLFFDIIQLQTHKTLNKTNLMENVKHYWKLYRLVDKCKGLGEKRHPMFEQNRAMKWFGYLMAAFWACYLIFFGVLLGTALSDSAIEGFDIINGGLLVFIALDFLLRLFQIGRAHV